MGPVLYEAHVMAGLDARHGEERHLLAGAVQRDCPWYLRGSNLHGTVRHPFPMTMDLTIDEKNERE